MPGLFLDALRIVAALIVLYVHVAELTGIYYYKPDVGHFAVIIFFALSGYVIAHTVSKNHKNKLEYAIARLSRLYSVVLPAIIFSIIVQLAIWKIQPDVFERYTRDHSALRYIFSTFFISELWFLSASPPINGPLWSLSYEFWYYVIFGFFFFKRSKSVKALLAPMLACFVAGPKILLMMPIWLAGNYAYHLQRPKLTENFSWFIICICLFTSVLLLVLMPSAPFILGIAPLYYSSQFITDLAEGVFVACALWLIPTNKIVIKQPDTKWITVIRKFADLTFAIYVFHVPFLVLWRAIYYKEVYSNKEMFTALFSILLLCVLIGLLLEKSRYIWTEFFSKFLIYLQRVTQKTLKRFLSLMRWG